MTAAAAGIDDAVEMPAPGGNRGWQYRNAAKQRKKSERRAKAKAARKARKQQRRQA